jgi:hypothetical protein
VWQKKRVIVTKDKIAIGRLDDDSETLLDEIPFADVITVREMVLMEEERLDKDNGHLTNAFMITTVTGGHNSGRTYYFQASTPDSYFQLTGQLLANAKAARKRAEFNTRFTKSQYNMRLMFNSRIFQYFSALLIVMVC